MLRQSAMTVSRALTRGKFSKKQTKKFPISAKRSTKNHYKGFGANREGRHIRVKGGAFKLEKKMLNKYIVPDLEGFKLKPYVARNTPKIEKTSV